MKKNTQLLDTPTFKYVNPFKTKKWASTGKQIAKESFLPIIFMLLILVAVMLWGLVIKKIPSRFLMEPKEMYGEKSDPTVNRLIICIVDFVIGISCCVGSYHVYKKRKIDLSFYLAFFAGTILWQSLGECLWHYGFVRLETYVSTPILLVLLPLLFFLAKKKKIHFAILVAVLSFMTNWLGHFILMAPAAALEQWLAIKTTYLIFGCSLGFLFMLYSFYLVFFAASDKQARMISSIALYISFAEIIISLIEGLK